MIVRKERRKANCWVFMSGSVVPHEHKFRALGELRKQVLIVPSLEENPRFSLPIRTGFRCSLVPKAVCTWLQHQPVKSWLIFLNWPNSIQAKYKSIHKTTKTSSKLCPSTAFGPRAKLSPSLKLWYHARASQIWSTGPKITYWLLSIFNGFLQPTPRVQLPTETFNGFFVNESC